MIQSRRITLVIISGALIAVALILITLNTDGSIYIPIEVVIPGLTLIASVISVFIAEAIKTPAKEGSEAHSIFIHNRGEPILANPKIIELLEDKNSTSRIAGLHAVKSLSRISGAQAEAYMDVLQNFIRQIASPDAPQPAQRIELELAISSWAGLMKYRPVKSNPLDLSNLKLDGLRLRHISLVGANLAGTSFAKADINGSDFSGANFSGANLEGCNATGTRFRLAIFDGANLEKSVLSEADMSSTLLRDANLSHIAAGNTDFSGAFIIRADLDGADLSSARLAETMLVGSNISGARLTDAILAGAEITDNIGAIESDGATHPRDSSELEDGTGLGWFMHRSEPTDD